MSALTATANPAKGSVVLSSQDVPDGALVITRTVKGVPSEVRGGSFNATTGGFFVEDSEPPFGDPMTYTVNDTVDDRNIQTNLVLNPKAATDTSNWAAGSGRTMTRETGAGYIPPRDAVTSLKLSPNTAGSASGQYADRFLSSCQPVGFGPGDYFFSGQMLYESPDLWEWLDVESQGTWANLETTKGTWSQVQSSSSLGAQQAFASLWVAVVGPTQTTQTLRTNLVTTPSFEGGALGSWAVVAGTGGTAAGSVQASGGLATGTGTHLARATWSAATTAPSGGWQFPQMPVAVATTYTGSAWLRASKAQQVYAAIQWLDGSNAVISTSKSAVVSLAANTAQRVSLTAVAPAGAVKATLQFLVDTTGSNWAASNTFDLDGALFEAATVLGAYFDGSTGTAGATHYAWTGTAFASTSVAQVTDYPVLTTPMQIIGGSVTNNKRWLTFQGAITVPAGSPANCRLALMQGTNQREYSVTWHLTTLLVSAASEVLSGGGLTYFDGDSALPANPAQNLVPGTDWTDLSKDASISWTGTPNASTSVFTGPSILTAKASLTASSASTGISEPVLLSDPVAPQLAVWFTLQDWGDLTYPARMNQYDVLGKDYRIAVSQVRGKPTGQMSLVTYDNQDAELAELLFAPGRILLFRNPNAKYQETYLYLAVGDVVKGKVGDGAVLKLGQRLWTVPFTVVERPTGLINATTIVNWSVADAGYPTWGDLFAGRKNWLDAALTAPGSPS